MANTSDCPLPSPWVSCYTKLGALGTILIICVIIIWIILGNLFVIVSVFNERKLRNQIQNWLIVSLASADLLVGLLVMPITLSYTIIGEWKLGFLLCELWLALDVLFVTASILNLCVISLDRYWSVSLPLTYPFRRSPKLVAALVVCAWSISFGICLPPLVGWRPDRVPGQCTLSTDLSYVLYSALGSFYIPLLLLAIVYSQIFRITRRQHKHRLRESARMRSTLTHQRSRKRTLEQYTFGSGSTFSGTDDSLSFQSRAKKPSALTSYSSPNNDLSWRQCSKQSTSLSPCLMGSFNKTPSPITPEHLSLVNEESKNGSNTSSPILEVKQLLQIESAISSYFGERLRAQSKAAKLRARQKMIKKRELQATIILGLILAAFCACWLPFFVLYLLGAFGYEAQKLTFDICFWLGYCNSGLNPAIYTIFNREFRRSFKRTLNKVFFLNVVE